MNSTSLSVGASAISGAMLGGVIMWLCQAAHVTPPPPDVAGTLGAIVLVIAHAVMVRWLAPTNKGTTP